MRRSFPGTLRIHNENRTEVLCPRVTQAAMIAAASFGLRRSGTFATATSGAAYWATSVRHGPPWPLPVNAPKSIFQNSNLIQVLARADAVIEEITATSARRCCTARVSNWHYPEASERTNEFRSLRCCGQVLLTASSSLHDPNRKSASRSFDHLVGTEAPQRHVRTGEKQTLSRFWSD